MAQYRAIELNLSMKSLLGGMWSKFRSSLIFEVLYPPIFHYNFLFQDLLFESGSSTLILPLKLSPCYFFTRIRKINSILFSY